MSCSSPVPVQVGQLDRLQPLREHIACFPNSTLGQVIEDCADRGHLAQVSDADCGLRLEQYPEVIALCAGGRIVDLPLIGLPLPPHAVFHVLEVLACQQPRILPRIFDEFGLAF